MGGFFYGDVGPHTFLLTYACVFTVWFSVFRAFFNDFVLILALKFQMLVPWVEFLMVTQIAATIPRPSIHGFANIKRFI